MSKIRPAKTHCDICDETNTLVYDISDFCCHIDEMPSLDHSKLMALWDEERTFRYFCLNCVHELAGKEVLCPY